MDHRVGQVLDTLDRLGIRDDTIVIFASDNGPEEVAAYHGTSGYWRGHYFTALEGSLRTPFLIRWPGKIPAGTVSNEIVHITDLLPTIASITGFKVPNDRLIDGIDQSDFLLGKKDKSDREFIVTYVGDRVFSVKWRTMKVHFFTAEGTFSPIVEHTFPQVFDIKNDPGETRELWQAEGYAHLWVMKPVMDILTGITISQRQYPNIKPGQDFSGYK